MKSGKTFILALLVILLAAPITNAQEDFEDDLEAELEAELGVSEETAEEEVSLGNEDTKKSASSESSNSSEASEKANSDSKDEFSEDGFDEAFSGEEDFGKDENLDFSEFDGELDEGEKAASGVPVEDNLDSATEELDLEPLEEEPSMEEFANPEPTGPVIEEPVAEEPSVPEPKFEEPVAAPAPMEEMASDAGPNLELEARLYNIYVNYHNSPTPEGEWMSMVGARQSELYQIQSGDTLWGVSETFFGDGNFWPKIWSVNNKIQNPHLISVGNQIQFVMGTESDAPMFTISETPAPTEEGKASGDKNFDLDMQTINELIESGALDAADAEQFKAAVKDKNPGQAEEVPAVEDPELPPVQALQEPDIEIPPPSIISRPVLKRLPPSVPEWQNTGLGGDYDELGISYSRRPIADLKDEIYLSSYIDDSELISDAKVVEIETGSRIAWELQYVYVQFPIGKGEPGSKYLVVENIGRLRAPNDYIDSSDLGYQKIISGMVTVGEKVKADVDEKKYEVYRAFVDKAINPLKLGGELVKGYLPLINLDDSGPRSDVVAQIIGGSLDKRRSVFGKSSVVFLNRGLADGLTEGQILSIRANRMVRNEDSKVLENQRVIGTLKVVKAANKFSTAVVTESMEDILAGDYTGEGRLLPRLVTEQMKKGGVISDPPSEKDFEDDTAFAEEGDSDLEKLLDEDAQEDGEDVDFDDFEGESDFE